MFLISMDTSAVFMWCCIIRGSGSFRNTASLSLVNRLHSVKRCWAVCSAFSGQLHSGVGALFLLWRYERKQPWFVRNCCRELKPVTFWWSTVTLRWYWISWKSVKWSKLWNSTHARARKHTHTHTRARAMWWSQKALYVRWQMSVG